MSHAHTHAPRRPQVPLGLWGTVRSIAQTEGIVGFYRGLGPTVLQILPYTGLMYYSYELAKVAVRAVTTSAPARGLVGPGDPGWITRDVEKLVSGSVAGLVSKTGTMPFDVVRKRLQVRTLTHVFRGAELTPGTHPTPPNSRPPSHPAQFPPSISPLSLLMPDSWRTRRRRMRLGRRCRSEASAIVSCAPTASRCVSIIPTWCRQLR